MCSLALKGRMMMRHCIVISLQRVWSIFDKFLTPLLQLLFQLTNQISARSEGGRVNNCFIEG